MGKLRKDPTINAGRPGLLKVLRQGSMGISDRLSYLQRIFPVLPTTAVRFFPSNNGHYLK